MYFYNAYICVLSQSERLSTDTVLLLLFWACGWLIGSCYDGYDAIGWPGFGTSGDRTDCKIQPLWREPKSLSSHFVIHRSFTGMYGNVWDLCIHMLEATIRCSGFCPHFIWIIGLYFSAWYASCNPHFSINMHVLVISCWLKMPISEFGLRIFLTEDAMKIPIVGTKTMVLWKTLYIYIYLIYIYINNESIHTLFVDESHAFSLIFGQLHIIAWVCLKIGYTIPSNG